MAVAITLSPPRLNTRPAVRWRLSRIWKQLVVLLHILSSVGLFGMTLVSFALTLIISTGKPAPDTVRPVLEILETLDRMLLPPMALATVGTGLMLSLGTHWGLLNHFWVVMKLVITIGVILTGATVINAAASEALKLATRSEFATSGGGLLGSPLALLLGMYCVHLVLLGAATAITVFKPWGMTPRGRAASAAMKSG